MTTNIDPVAVILVTSGTRGDRLLFRYPNPEPDTTEKVQSKSKRRNPYAVKVSEDHLYLPKGPITTNIKNNTLVGFSGQILSNLLAVKSELCGQPFNVKMDDVCFIGYPLTLDQSKSKTSSSGKTSHQIISFNIAFVLKASVNSSVTSCYNDLVKQLMVSIHHEESRCQYLSSQAKIMISIHDEVAAMPEDSVESPYSLILQRSSLARDLRAIFENLCDSGVLHMYINKWVELSFCLPHKIHVIRGPNKPIEPEAIQKCLESLRPYHGILLLVDKQSLQESLPVDCSPALSRLVSVTTPLQSLQVLSLEADISLSQVFQIVSHLVYWAKAIIIYPLCETNMYVLSPLADRCLNSKLANEFADQFGKLLSNVLAEFSFPTQLRESRDILCHPKQQDQKVKMVVWMLQNRLLIQLHTYVIFSPSLPRRHKKISDETLRSSGMPIVPEEESLASVSDIASVNSDESFSMGYASTYTSQFSKSPSSDGSHVSEDRGYWPLQDNLQLLRRDERDCVLNLPAAKNTEDLKLFARLHPYFTGKHHLEEIMYYENLHRSQLMTLIDKFRPVLITCQYEDPATVFMFR